MRFQSLPVDQVRTGVTLAANVWLATGVTVLPGCTVGAGSVVTKDVPAKEVWAGVPARKIRDIT
jgi:acetyltransferase-like isoleucine patch superfamily enzyme